MFLIIGVDTGDICIFDINNPIYTLSLPAVTEWELLEDLGFEVACIGVVGTRLRRT